MEDQPNINEPLIDPEKQDEIEEDEELKQYIDNINNGIYKCMPSCCNKQFTSEFQLHIHEAKEFIKLVLFILCLPIYGPCRVAFIVWNKRQENGKSVLTTIGLIMLIPFFLVYKFFLFIINGCKDKIKSS